MPTHALLLLLPIALTSVTVGLMLPQMWRSCWRGQTAGLSTAAVWLSPVSCGAWLTYGVLMHDGVQMGINLACGLMHLAVLMAVLRGQPGVRQRASLMRSLPIPAAGLVAVMALVGAGACGWSSPASTAGLVGLAATAISMSSQLPQPWVLAQMVHSRRRCGVASADVSGISLGRYRLALVSSALWITHGVLLGQAATVASSVLSITATSVVLGYVAAITRRQRALRHSNTLGLLPAHHGPTEVVLQAA